MAHGEKDYTRTTAAKVVAAKIDLDLPVILIDRFDSANFLWARVGAPAGWDVLLTADAAYEGDAGMMLCTSIIAAGAGEWVQATVNSFTTPARKLSLTTLFRVISGWDTVRSIMWLTYGRYNDLDYEIGVRYRSADRAWDYWVNGMDWVEFLTNTHQGFQWQRMHLEADLENMRYISFETADHRIPLHEVPIWYVPNGGSESTMTHIIVYNDIIGTQARVAFDNIIIKELGT